MHDVRPSGPMHDMRNLEGVHGRCVCVSFLFEAYVMHYYRVNKPLKIREHYSVFVMAEKLLITLQAYISKISDI